VDAPLTLWIFRLAWLALPFTLAEQIDSVTASSPDAVRLSAAALFWTLWLLAFGASLVPLPSTLTVLRMLAPGAPLAAFVCLAFDTPEATGWAGLAVAVACAVIVMSAPVGDWFVDGGSYGDERRFALKPPVALLLGPIELAWALATIPAPAGLLLLADRRWALGALSLCVGVLGAWWGYSACRQLSLRWAVFVPAGLTLVDDMALVQPVLFAASSIGSLGPAREGTDAEDLTVGAPGLVLELGLDEPVELIRTVPAGGVSETTAVSAAMFVPSRPGTLLQEADRRGLAVDTTTRG
jgi:hypothetical protein